ncbi:unnamed protein product, partial [Ectocarpus fasciculatus]
RQEGQEVWVTLKMLAAKKSAGAVVVFLAASCSRAASFMASPPSATSAAAASVSTAGSSTLNRGRTADACRRCSLDATTTTSDANERWQRQGWQWRGGSGGQSRGRR